MDNPKNQIAEKLKGANNVLVTVSANPTIDQLAAAIGLTLLLNKLDKHASAVFSGQVPSTIEFLKPDETIEKNTDSLRDFIIALDKSKADKLRYKVEDTMVKIFITPYRTSITDQDLIFSQGDFNVDVVVGLGVKVREDLDQAIVSHGGILHDATVVSINTTEVGSLGSINWVDAQASSLCEMMVAAADLLKVGIIDGQIATALLTGIVAETERFSNAKTTSNTMNASAKLMAAGANQQLVATQLQEANLQPVLSQPIPQEVTEPDSELPTEEPTANTDNGTLEVEHQDELPEPRLAEDDAADEGNAPSEKSDDTPQDTDYDSRKFMTKPPDPVEPEEVESVVNPVEENDNVNAEESSAATQENKDEPEAIVPPLEDKQADTDENLETEEPLVSKGTQEPPAVDSFTPDNSVPITPPASTGSMQYIETPQPPQLETLDSIEHKVNSPHLNNNSVTAAYDAPSTEPEPVEEQPPIAVPADEVPDESNLDQARNAVQAAVEQTPNIELPGEDELVENLPDIQIDSEGNISPPPTVVSPTVMPSQPVEHSADTQLPHFGLPAIPLDSAPKDPGAPPEVPPPMMPPTMPLNGASSTLPTPSPFSLLPPTQ